MLGKKRLTLALVLLLFIGGGVCWYERCTLRSWWVLRGLCRADEDSRDVWVRRVTALEPPPVEALLDAVGGDDERARVNAASALDHLARGWGAADPRTADLAARLARGCGRLCPCGRACLLERMAGWIDDQPPSPGFVAACSRFLGEAVNDETAHSAGLELAAALLVRPNTGEACRSARELARAGLRSSDAEARLRAVRVGLLPGVDLLDEIAGLLRDPDASVRRAAVVAVGPNEQVVRDEGLLAGLHDSDPEVRRLTEDALKGRGLKPEHLLLGKLLTHPQATARLQLLDHLSDEDIDVDPCLWLRRLSHDSSPAVRAAALRVMSQQTALDLSDRIDQMARSDPSPTVAQMAKFYLNKRTR